MSPTDCQSSFGEDDFKQVLRIIHNLTACKNSEELNQVLKDDFLKHFKAQSFFYGWTDPGTAQSKHAGSHGFSKEEVQLLEQKFHCDPLIQFSIQNNKNVVAYGVDVPRPEEEDIHSTLPNQPEECFQKGQRFFSSNVSAMLALDLPCPGFGLTIYRQTSESNFFSSKEACALEFIQPVLFSTIKKILTTGNLAFYKSIAFKALNESHAPSALVCGDFKIIFISAAFCDHFPLKPGDPLPKELKELVKTKISQLQAQPDLNPSRASVGFHSLKPEASYLVVNLHGRYDTDENGCYLLGLDPSSKKHSSMGNLISNSGLTPKESEVAFLVREGLDNNEIALRLFISNYTVKNHLKGIYRKLSVNSRIKLITLLNEDKGP